MGLNEMYTTVRGSILMMRTLPSRVQAFDILCQEEQQREVKHHNHTALDSTSLNAYGKYKNNAGYKGFRTNYSSSKGVELVLVIQAIIMCLEEIQVLTGLF